MVDPNPFHKYVNASVLGRLVRDVLKCAESQTKFDPLGKKINGLKEAADFIIELFECEDGVNRTPVFSGKHPEKGVKEAFWNMVFSSNKWGAKNLKFFIETLINHDHDTYMELLSVTIYYYNREFKDKFGLLEI